MHFKIHNNFKLNDTSFTTREELLLFSNAIFEVNFIAQFLDDTETIKLQTSGSTGALKVIEVRKEFMINSAQATGVFFNLKEDTKALLCMNPNYIGGKMMLVRAMLLGWHLDVVTPSSTPLKDSTKKYDFSAMVPLQVHNSLKNLDKVKKLIIGGGVVSNSLKMALQDISTECYSTYGMTETVSHIAVKKVNNFLSDTERSPSVYNLLPNVHISTDSRNCLIINAPKVAETQIITNDVVELISKTAFKWLGRYDNIINSGGVKLNPEQIEATLSQIINQRFFVAGIPDEGLGEKLILVIEGISTTLNDQKNIILNEVKNLKLLTKYEIPKEVYFLPSFIETETKKIQRKKTLYLIKW
jgi:O-succinylbenzoic acid--CoA ligase